MNISWDAIWDSTVFVDGQLNLIDSFVSNRDLINATNQSKASFERILTYAFDFIDYNHKDSILIEDFSSLMFYFMLIAKIFAIFEEIDTNNDEKIDVYNFTSFLIKNKIELDNPFREFHTMDRDKDGNIKVENFCYFYAR